MSRAIDVHDQEWTPGGDELGGGDDDSRPDLAGGTVDRDELFTRLNEELRQAAMRLLRRQPGRHTLQPTALVNEAFLKLSGNLDQRWSDDAHALAVAAAAMRQILVDHARRKRAVKRPPPELAMPLDAVVLGYEANSIDLLALDEALTELAAVDPLMADVVNCRFFLGYSFEELSRRFELSTRTLERRWVPTKAWLLARIA